MFASDTATRESPSTADQATPVGAASVKEVVLVLTLPLVAFTSRSRALPASATHSTERGGTRARPTGVEKRAALPEPSARPGTSMSPERVDT